jgi:uncharacterized protein YdeI (YjbR/CyaY-like superfamily)
MAKQLITLDFRNRQQWRTWLGKHHASSPGVWLSFYKKHTGIKSIPYALQAGLAEMISGAG